MKLNVVDAPTTDNVVDASATEPISAATDYLQQTGLALSIILEAMSIDPETIFFHPDDTKVVLQDQFLETLERHCQNSRNAAFDVSYFEYDQVSLVESKWKILMS